MRKTIVVSALLLALASAAHAGDMQNDKPQPASGATQTTSTQTAPILVELVYAVIAALRVAR